MNTTLAVSLAVLIQFMLASLITFLIVAVYVFRRKKNNIDIVLYECTGTGYKTRSYIGRFVKDAKKGNILVTAGLFPGSIKLRLSPTIKDQDLVVGHAPGRKTAILAVKDEIYIPVHFTEFEESFNATPITQEQIQFHLSVYDDIKDRYSDGDKQFGRTMAIVGVSIFGIVVIGAIIIIVLLMNQGPDFAEKANALQNAKAAAILPSNLPG